MKLCTIDDCSKPHKARGLCDMHYNRYQRNGTPILPKLTGATGCYYVGCDRLHYVSGLCENHYRWTRKPLIAEAQHYCARTGCNIRTRAGSALCGKHRNYGIERERITPEDREKFLEEYEFFRSWRMTDERLAECLHITVDTLQKRVERWVTADMQVAS